VLNGRHLFSCADLHPGWSAVHHHQLVEVIYDNGVPCNALANTSLFQLLIVYYTQLKQRTTYVSLAVLGFFSEASST
jgi:hypothetical protein